MKYSFDLEIAKSVGVDEAIVYNNLYFWCEKNKANKKHFYDGLYWTYNSQEAFVDLFPFWSRKQVMRILNSLEKKNYIKKGNYNKASFDRTMWYACLVSFNTSIVPNGTIDSPESDYAISQTGQPIPDSINTDNKTYNTPTENTEVLKKCNELQSEESRAWFPRFLYYFLSLGWTPGKGETMESIEKRVKRIIQNGGIVTNDDAIDIFKKFYDYWDTHRGDKGFSKKNWLSTLVNSPNLPNNKNKYVSNDKK